MNLRLSPRMKIFRLSFPKGLEFRSDSAIGEDHKNINMNYMPQTKRADMEGDTDLLFPSLSSHKPLRI